jgi:hypothetical protein
MKNIILSADEQLIEQARLLAKSQHKTLNAMFREWLERFTAQRGRRAGVRRSDRATEACTGGAAH